MIRSLGIATTTFLLLAGVLSAQEPRKPNIVLIISDDQAWTDYGFTGHADIKTPNLDQLAKQSVVFRRGYVPTSLCRPSLATIITGRYAHEHGITGNDPSPKNIQPQSELYRERRQTLIDKLELFETLPKALAKAGYASFQTGKWWEGNFRNGGFTEGMTQGFPNPQGRHGDAGLEIGRSGLNPIFEFIDRASSDNKPFFVWYAPLLPHSPHNPPERLLKKYHTNGRPEPIAKYYAMCEWFDETCGELLRHLDDSGVRENTIVIYVTDNGWIQDPTTSGYAPRSKQTPYEGGVRTPILFSWHNHWPNADRSELASSLDIVPTLLAATGCHVPDDLPGLDLNSNLATGKPIARNAILGEGFAHDIADIDEPEASLLYRWCIRDEWKLILSYDGEINRSTSTHPRNTPGIQLFNLGDDPSETKNLAKQNPMVVHELQTQITNWYPLKNRKILTESSDK